MPMPFPGAFYGTIPSYLSLIQSQMGAVENWGYYKFDDAPVVDGGQFTDSSGNAAHGSYNHTGINGDYTDTFTGVIPGSYAFDSAFGTETSVEAYVPSDTHFPLLGTTHKHFVYEAWVYWDNTQGGTTTHIMGTSGFSTRLFSMQIAGTYFGTLSTGSGAYPQAFIRYSGGQSRRVIAANPWGAGDIGWHMLTFVHQDGGTTTLYIDGVQEDTDSTAQTGDFYCADAEPNLNLMGSSNKKYFGGIDEVLWAYGSAAVTSVGTSANIAARYAYINALGAI